MKWTISRLVSALVVFAGALAAFWAGSSRAQGTNKLMLAADYSARGQRAYVATASKRWQQPDACFVRAFPAQCILSATLDAPQRGKVLVTGDVTFRPSVLQWAGLEIALVQGDATVGAPRGHWSYCGNNGTFFCNLSFSAVLEIPNGGPWNVQLLTHASSPAIAHTAHVNAVYLGE